MSILLVLFVIALSSCTFESTIPVTLSIAEEHPFEELYGKDMWYELSYADGRETKTVHIAPGIRDVTVQVYSGGLRMFVMKPLGELGAIGGFFEPGDDSHVALISEEGEFADILLSAFEYRPDAVSRLSMKKVKAANRDLSEIDQTAFLTALFDGKLNPNTITRYAKGNIAFDSIPEGEWISERYENPSFSVEWSGEEIIFDIYPGVYRYIEKERSLLLTIIYTEDGEHSATIRQSPLL